MFDSLSDKLQAVFRQLSGKGRLDERDIDEAMKEVRRALLEADVNFKVVRQFEARVKERALGAEVLRSLTPAQQVIKIVHEELVAILGGGNSRLEHAPQPPTIIMLVGLQGSGKTTTAAKLALHLRRAGQRPLLVAADVRRPAAIDQLVTLGRQLDVPVHHEPPAVGALAICRNALRRARELNATHLLLDTAGRLTIDEEMMGELVAIRDALAPHETLLVADAMTGQDAVRTAETFHARVGLTGLILTKIDGDARGGAALSIRAVTGVPIKFLGVGEKADAIEPFHPDRLASRILGMGDVLTLIERAQAAFDQEQALKLQKKMRQATFDLEDFLAQLQQLKKMGPLQQILELIPGMNRLTKSLPSGALDDRQLKRIEAIIYSMTPEERRHPEILNGSRRRRIARGSGTTPADVNELIRQFMEMRKLMKQMTTSGPLRAGKLPKGVRLRF
ncbi:MAG: signal recognition particle protein [Chloroflexota bacterium]|nr:signal recognition particle protein [Dehalococcoidia bacterium]MDW8252310.1 signal recognition particle protein [Chloroflexota bacterium]